MQLLEQRLISLVHDSPATALDRLQAGLTQGAITPESSPAAVRRALAPAEIPGYVLTTLLKAWNGVGATAMPPAALAMALGATRRMHAQMAAATPQLDLVWTGPYGPADIRARSTADAMQEIIAGAESKVLLVGYNLNQASAVVVNALARAMTAGRRVIIALHDDGENHANLVGLWPKHLRLPRLLRWVGQPGDRIASLHAKLLVVDSKDLLVTSANLTWHGLEQNIEVGVRIRGDFAAQVDSHFAKLEREGILVPHQGGLG